MPARTIFVTRPALTETLPCLTVVRVPAQESSTSQRVPRTVAALYLPVVRKAPLPSPHSLRFFAFLAAALARPFFGHAASGSVSVRLVMPFVCVTLNSPS